MENAKTLVKYVEVYGDRAARASKARASKEKVGAMATTISTTNFARCFTIWVLLTR